MINLNITFENMHCAKTNFPNDYKLDDIANYKLAIN